MTERERLIKLLNTFIFPREGADPAEVVADFFLDNGVRLPVLCKDCFFAMPVENREPKYKCINICRDGCKQLVASDDYCSYGDRTENICGERRADNGT